MSVLAFLAEPAFVGAWYLAGALAAGWVGRDLMRVNTALKPAMKWAWPIIVFFFSLPGLALYLATARAPGVGRARDEQAKRRLHDAFERSMLRRVNGAVIHCVAGDGLGIITAMVIARLAGMSFWQEFWFEYAAGFAFGLFIFQLKSMTLMTDRIGRALWMAFRAEFFSMLTVMGGMGAVMTWVTPMVVGAQPRPDTAAFWGFAALGLVVGYVFTLPMNGMLVAAGWKHGMGHHRGGPPVRAPAARTGLFATMAALGVAAMALPAWLTVLREARPVASLAEIPGGAALPGEALGQTLAAALRELSSGERAGGVGALDAAMRATMVLRARDAQAYAPVLRAIRHARHHVQDGRLDAAAALIERLNLPPVGVGTLAGHHGATRSYGGVPLLDSHGAVVGELRQERAGQVQVALGGAHDVLGFWDAPRRVTWVPAAQVVFGPRRFVGKSYAMLLPPVPAG